MVASEGYVTDSAYIPGFYPNMSPLAMRYVAALNKVVPPKTDKAFRYHILSGDWISTTATLLVSGTPRNTSAFLLGSRVD